MLKINLIGTASDVNHEIKNRLENILDVIGLKEKVDIAIYKGELDVQSDTNYYLNKKSDYETEDADMLSSQIIKYLILNKIPYKKVDVDTNSNDKGVGSAGDFIVREIIDKLEKEDGDR